MHERPCLLALIALLIASISIQAEEQASRAQKQAAKVGIISRTILSTRGSNMATAYSLSNRIISAKAISSSRGLISAPTSRSNPMTLPKTDGLPRCCSARLGTITQARQLPWTARAICMPCSVHITIVPLSSEDPLIPTIQHNGNRWNTSA